MHIISNNHSLIS